MFNTTKQWLEWEAPPLVIFFRSFLFCISTVKSSVCDFLNMDADFFFYGTTAVAQTADLSLVHPGWRTGNSKTAFCRMRSNISVPLFKWALSAAVCIKRASLTLHSAQDERFNAVEFHIRCQVEVLSGILVNLQDNVCQICAGKSLAGKLITTEICPRQFVTIKGLNKTVLRGNFGKWLQKSRQINMNRRLEAQPGGLTCIFNWDSVPKLETNMLLRCNAS